LERENLRDLYAFEQIQIWFDGKNQKQDDEKVFAVRFTVKTIRWDAIDAIDARKMIF
jgi:hypothetical protein